MGLDIEGAGLGSGQFGRAGGLPDLAHSFKRRAAGLKGSHAGDDRSCCVRDGDRDVAVLELLGGKADAEDSKE